MNLAIAQCLRADTRVAAIEDVSHWLPEWRAVAAAHASPIDRAIAGGFAADRVAWAFAAGYQAALRALVPDLPGDALAAICVTEEAGNRPRDIRTTITPRADGAIAISGGKRWTTLGPHCSVLLVVGRVVDAAAGRGGPERPQLRVARVPSGAAGLSLRAMPAIGFAPEVPHARVQLDEVRLPASALLPGDGYEAYVKPFRTLEDTHVSAAVLAYLLREARARGWPAGLRERLVATLVALAALAAHESAGPPRASLLTLGGADAALRWPCELACGADAPATHVALEGALQWAHRLYDEAGALWAAAADEAAARWQRDTALLAVAAGARARRAAKAWERLQARGDSHE